MGLPKQLLLTAIACAVIAGCGSEPSVRAVAPPAAETAQTDKRTEDLLRRMSVDEKVAIVSGMGMSMTLGSQGDFDRVPGTAGYTHAIPSVGLKSIALADGPAGLRIWPEREGDSNRYYATAFPIASLVASTWDSKLVETMGAAMGNEVKEYGVDVLLAPGMNIHRNPLTGRNFEYYSEDPLLSGTMAGAMVNGVESNGVGATIKHFVANNLETNRLDLDAQISERALRELYLKGFRIALEAANPWAVMSAYNGINGTPSSQNKKLLTTVLRDEWGYEGVVMTDWFAGKDPVAQLKAGNDLLMPGMPERTALIKAAIESGTFTEAELDVNVARIINTILKSPTQQEYAYSDKPDLKAHAEVVRSVAAEGVVLLKNAGGALPLSSSTRNVGAFGVGAYGFIAGGTGSGDVNEAYTVSLVDGLKNAGINVDAPLADHYAQYRKAEQAKLPEKKLFFLPDTPLPEMQVDSATLADVVARTDIGFITLGRSAGEFIDRKMEADYLLTPAELQMIDDVSRAYHQAGKKVVMILNIGNVIDMAGWRDSVDAIVLPWQGGQEAGNAVTDVLTGKVNPSGKLPTTFPLAYNDLPTVSERQFPGKVKPGAEPTKLLGMDWGYPATVWYDEGIFVGYRYFDTFNVDVAYPFGFGLSYTGFSITKGADVQVLNNGAGFEIPVTVKNTGKVAGKQVVQLYVSAPQSTLPKPAKELKAFAKTGLLSPGQSETLTLRFSLKDLASFYPQQQSWVADAGNYTVSVATSVEDIAFQSTFTIDKTTVVEKVKTSFQPTEKLNLMEAPQ